jgi:hypothetical protein
MANVKIDPSHVVRGPFPDIPKFPDTDIYTFMFHREEVGNFPPARSPNRLAFIDGPSGKSITFRELKERVILLSRGFSKGMKLKAGDVVCYYMPNHVYLV